MLRISYHGHAQVVHSAELLANGEDVQQGLGWVLANAIASIDEWLIQELCIKRLELCKIRASQG
jgi:hypothetical protein